MHQCIECIFPIGIPKFSVAPYARNLILHSSYFFLTVTFKGSVITTALRKRLGRLGHLGAATSKKTFINIYSKHNSDSETERHACSNECVAQSGMSGEPNACYRKNVEAKGDEGL
ncbi:hypothetical protein EVAR_25389_1 [Eumeta japonica]|uniref:Uncharacterized protein n=1 Tax=Eumeta variegata TaxID=151549 RepID=A0A4C1V4Q4_EUMVA|nr:hypothetical protein EVAR_25389_1 [Eumeta japonica]